MAGKSPNLRSEQPLEANSILELKKLMKDAETELAKRQLLKKTLSDIEKLIAKRKLSFSDILNSCGSRKDFIILSSKNEKSTSRKHSANQRVPMKYQSLDGAYSWSGRGRTPRWVQAVCEKHNLTISEFKLSDEFR